MAMTLQQPSPPAPSDPAERERVSHTALRRRLLYSCHERDLDELMQTQLGRVRKSAWGKPDLTANPYLSLWSQTAMLYSAEPEVVAPDAAGEELLGAVTMAGLWPLMQRVQRDTLALREMAVHVGVEAGELVYRPVFPDLMEATASKARPSSPVAIREWRWVDGVWLRFVASIEDPSAPVYRVEDRAGMDVSKDVLGGSFAGDAYPYRGADGAPLLPYVLYHAAETGYLWDPYTLREVVEGSLNIGLLLTYYQHVVRNAAYSQRYVVGVEVDGAEGVTADGVSSARREVVTDPSTLLMLRQAEDASQPIIGQWSPPVDPESLLRSVSMYERRILTMAGLAPPDVTRQEADVRSGYSLAVARESVREAQRVSEPMFRRGDLELLRVSAAMLGVDRGRPIPGDGYRINYRGLPPSPIERAAEREQVVALMAAGLLGRVEAYQRLNPGVTEAQASAEVARIAAENRATA